MSPAIAEWTRFQLRRASERVVSTDDGRNHKDEIAVDGGGMVYIVGDRCIDMPHVDSVSRCRLHSK